MKNYAIKLLFFIPLINTMEKPLEMEQPFLSNEEKNILKKVLVEYQYNKNQEQMRLEQAQEKRERIYQAEQDYRLYQIQERAHKERINKQLHEQMPKDFCEKLGEFCVESGTECCPMGCCVSLWCGTCFSGILNCCVNLVKCGSFSEELCMKSNDTFLYATLITCLGTTVIAGYADNYVHKRKNQREELRRKLMRQKAD